jgi:hypothetical protein
MRSAMMVWVSLVGVAVVTRQADLESQGSPQPPIREIALDTLHDVAVAVYDPKGSIIYYNPDYLQRLGPQLSAFFMAHEYGHISLRHTRAHALAGNRKTFNARLQEQELAADCYAAAKLAGANPSAVGAAMRRTLPVPSEPQRSCPAFHAQRLHQLTASGVSTQIPPVHPGPPRVLP